MDKEQVRAAIAKVIEDFEADTKRAKYKEDQLRQSYIERLFEALGWNMRNPNEVTVEETMKGQYPDYGFYVNGLPVFFVETKRIKKQLDTPENIRQTMKYARIRGVTWAVLTDFTRLMVFNSDFDYDDDEDVFKTRWHNLTYQDYTDTKYGFDLLWLLSKPAMQIGEIDTRGRLEGRKYQREDVTESLFDSLTEWRERLFNQISSYDKHKQQRQFDNLPLFQNNAPVIENARKVDNAIQRLIDRLIFIRTMEDRSIEEYRLKSIANQYPRDGDLTPELLDLFRDYDRDYNSNLFRKSDIDDMMPDYSGELLKTIISGLYHDSKRKIDYNFAYLNADVLGTVYEQYLSFKAQDPLAEIATAKSRKRKSQGIYYTPPYIVRYIVQNTLGKVLEAGADPTTIRVLDPACGSGSFLIVAFDMLYNWRKQKEKDRDDRAIREDILRHNLFGVDLDEQALEVTRLNLMVRASRERKHLPYFTNLRHGNSLISDKAHSEHAFNWDAFGDGFDVVLGNPPYVRQETLGAAFKDYAQDIYQTFSGTADLYVYFIEKGYELLREGGRMGYIVPNKWLRANYGRALREFLQDKLDHLLDFGDLPVFPDATTYPLILTLGKKVEVIREASPEGTPLAVTHVKQLPAPNQSLDSVLDAEFYGISRNTLDRRGWSLADEREQGLLDKLQSLSMPLGNYVTGTIYMGIKTGLNEAFVIDRTVCDELLRQPKNADLIKPFLAGRDVKRYEQPTSDKFLISIPNGWTDAQTDATDKWAWLQSTYPAIAAHLEPFAIRAQKRTDKGCYWWELRPCAYYPEFEKTKIVYQVFQVKPGFAFDTGKLLSNNATYIIPKDDKLLLGILNSKLGWFCISKYCTKIQNGYQLIFDYLKKVPIRRLDMANLTEKSQHDEIVRLVENMLALKTELAELSSSAIDKRVELEADIQHKDAQIDHAVYGLYRLTDAEIAIIERTVKG
jgi:type I restriction-modification system DNA methylase subunit